MRDEVRHCSVCEETTAHQVRGAPWPTLFGVLLIGLGALSMLLGDPATLLVALPLLGLGFWIVQRDRAQRWNLTCGRCRARATASLRKPWVPPAEVMIS